MRKKRRECPVCGSTEVVTSTGPEEFELKNGRKIIVDNYTLHTCKKCGEAVTDPESRARGVAILRKAQEDESMVTPGDPFGVSVGFTKEDFDGQSYLCIIGDAVWISLIMVRAKAEEEPKRTISRMPERTGKFKAMIEKIRAKGYRVKIPTPLGRMGEIVRKAGYVQTVEGDCEVWVLG